MAKVDDVAAAILKRTGRTSTMKLQKLIYYCQAWHLVWEERPLFRAKIEAWANGPVVRSIYEKHRGRFEVATWPQGDASQLSTSEQESVTAVLGFYGDRTAQWLSELTHQEDPWLEARHGLGPGIRGNTEITHAAMAEYYSSL
jgi:uncharacterized phage-associated protein